MSSSDRVKGWSHSRREVTQPSLSVRSQGGSLALLQRYWKRSVMPFAEVRRCLAVKFAEESDGGEEAQVGVPDTQRGSRFHSLITRFPRTSSIRESVAVSNVNICP